LNKKQLVKLLNGYEKYILSQFDKKSVLKQVEMTDLAAKYGANFVAGLEMPKKEFDEAIRQFTNYHNDLNTARN
jgi:hypothetical protein